MLKFSANKCHPLPALPADLASTRYVKCTTDPGIPSVLNIVRYDGAVDDDGTNEPSAIRSKHSNQLQQK